MFDFDTDRIPLGPFDTWHWWLLIGISLALLFTLQALETVVEGAWPHQQRDNIYVPGAKGIKPAWSLAALLVLPGALASIGIVATMIWLGIDAPEGFSLGGSLLALGWVLFLVFGLNFFGLGRLLGTLGMLGPLAIAIVLFVSDGLLIITLLDILPAWDIVWDAIQNGLRDILPFLPEGSGND